MAISEKLINKSKNNVMRLLTLHFNATAAELYQMDIRLTDPEDWTCGFEDELLPLFLEMRKNIIKNK